MCPPGSGPGADKENIQVIETDYVNFALVLSLRQTSNQSITRVSLLGEPLLPWALCMTLLREVLPGFGTAWGQIPHHCQVLRAMLSSGHR